MADLRATRRPFQSRLAPDSQTTCRRLKVHSRKLSTCRRLPGDSQATHRGTFPIRLGVMLVSAFWSKQTETKSRCFDMHHSLISIVEVTLNWKTLGLTHIFSFQIISTNYCCCIFFLRHPLSLFIQSLILWKKANTTV